VKELATVRKGLKNNKALGADFLVNEFFKHGGSRVKNQLLKIMSVIFRKGEL